MLRRFKIVSRCEGAAAVEFAIVLPVFLLILAGMFDFGWAFYWQHTVTNASREGARYAVQARLVGGDLTTYTDAEITKLVKDNYGTDLVVTVNPASAGTTGTSRSVTVTKPMTYFVAGVLNHWGVVLPTTISNQTTMTME